MQLRAQALRPYGNKSTDQNLLTTEHTDHTEKAMPL
jgi:hypothetical protein